LEEVRSAGMINCPFGFYFLLHKERFWRQKAFSIPDFAKNYQEAGAVSRNPLKYRWAARDNPELHHGN
jgi:hypothetical protein